MVQVRVGEEVSEFEAGICGGRSERERGLHCVVCFGAGV